MSGSWKTFTAPNTSTGTFTGDIMILLTDGSVLIHNGYTTNLGAANQWLRLTPDQNGHYETGSWSSELDMQYARQWFASGVLPDGRVFCIGGEATNDPAYPTGDAASGEIFDPTANGGQGAWSTINKPAAFTFVRGDCNGSVLADGRVLIGGASVVANPAQWSAQTAIWDSSDNTWVQAGLEFGGVANTTKTDSFEEESWGLLQDGSVLAPAVRDTPGAQRYVPSLDQWVTCNPSPQKLAIISITTATYGTVSVYETGSIIVLPSGGAYAIGGTGNTAVFTPSANATGLGSWTQGPAFPADNSAGGVWPTLTALDAPAALLPNGKVVLLAGNATYTDDDYFSSNPVFLEFDPSSSATTLPQLDVQPTSPALPSGNQTWQSCFLVLPTGQLLVSAQSSTFYLYTPDPAAGSPEASWAPYNIQVPSVMITGHSYTLSGNQLNGLSQCSAYGDDAGMATNYPIVQLTNISNGNIAYLRSYNFSSMGITPGAASSCQIDIPANLAPGNYNLVVIANGIASQATAVQIAAQDCFFILDYSTFSVGEVDSYVKAMPPVNAVFSPAFYVVVEGYTPSQIGINTSMPIGPQLANPPIKPSVPSPFPSDMLIAFAGPMIPEDPTLPNTPQRFTFPFSITFTDDAMFTTSAQNVTLQATFAPPSGSVSNSAVIELIPNPNPYILHGDQTLNPPEPWYLSQDLRVFQMIADPSVKKFNGLSIGTTGSASQVATTFIQAAVNNLRGNVGTSVAEFNALSQDEDTAVLQLQPTDPVSKKPVYNFAIARVRLRDTQNASNVRMFFRIWQAQQTNASYNSTTYARAMNTEAPPQPISVLGVQGDEIITIPFFAQPRVLASQQLHVQQDDFNRHDIDFTPGGESDYFFGCWLDINQPNDLVYPQRIEGVSADGPFDTVRPLFPIQQFMVAAHQCLIAEIAFDPDPIAPNSDPSNSDKLAQRNLAFVGAPNPGHPLSRRVPQTFEVKPSAPNLPPSVKPDELMIEWENVPTGSFAEVYLPAVSADQILATANLLYTSHLLSRADGHTLRFPAAGVTYIPIPPGAGVTYAGLLTLDLPGGIVKGDTYYAIVRQTTSVISDAGDNNIAAAAVSQRLRQWRRTTGTFKMTIPVSTKAELLGPEETYLSIMKNTSEAIPVTSRWYLIMQRYLKQLAGRVTFMGGNPTQVPPTSTGIWKLPPPLPHPHREQHYTGKIETLIYDHFGDFVGFTLESEHGEIHRLESREPRVEKVARLAWQERSRVMVTVESKRPHRPLSIVLLV